MYVYVYICINVYIYMCECIHKYVYIRIYTYICTCIYIYMYIFIHKCTYIYVYIYIRIYIYIYMYIHTYTCTHIYISVYIYTYTYEQANDGGHIRSASSRRLCSRKYSRRAVAVVRCLWRPWRLNFSKVSSLRNVLWKLAVELNLRNFGCWDCAGARCSVLCRQVLLQTVSQLLGHSEVHRVLHCVVHCVVMWCSVVQGGVGWCMVV